MSLRRTGALALGLIAACAAPAIATALVETWVSNSGETTINIEMPSGYLGRAGIEAGRYQQAGGAGGILTTTERHDISALYLSFRDTSGAERCIGRLTLRRGSAQATWQIDGTVEGYRCSTVGQTFQMNLREIDN